jgi:hypothetical protein
MKSPHNDNHVISPRRHLLGAVAAAVTGIVGVKLGRRERTAPLAAVPSSDGAVETIASGRPSRIVVKPAPHSVKRHG